MTTAFQHLIAHIQQSAPAPGGASPVDAFTRALFRDLAHDPKSIGDRGLPHGPPSWRPLSGELLDVPWLRETLSRFAWFDPELVEVRVGEAPRIDGGPNRLGVNYDLGLLMLRVRRKPGARTNADDEATRLVLTEAATRELFMEWVRASAGGELDRLRELRQNFVLYVLLDGEAFDAPQVWVAGASQTDAAEGPTVGVLPINLRRMQEGHTSVTAIRAQLQQALEPLSARGAAGKTEGNWRAAFGASGLSIRDRFRERVKQVIQELMGVLEQTAGPKGQAQDDAALGHLREAASIVFFRLMFLVTLENRSLLWKPTATKMRVKWQPFDVLAAERHADADGAGLFRGLLFRCREVRSEAQKSPLSIHGASIFRSRPTAEFHPDIERWLAPLDALDVSAPKLPAALLSDWERVLAAAVAVALGQLGEASEGAQAVVGLGASAHAQRVLGDVYEQILAMQPVREASGKAKSGKIVLRVAGGKAAKKAAEAGGKADTAKNERSALGAHYTPELLVNEVVRAGLEPLFADAWRRAGGLPPVAPSQRPPRANKATLDAYERELLSLRIVDPAMGSGHFLTVAVLELAREIAYMRHFGAPQPASHFEVAEVAEPWATLDAPAHGGEPGLAARLDAVATARLQELAQRCCFGVDRKPLAVELGKLALWLMTMVARRDLTAEARAGLPEAPPLTFLDKNLRSGDSLLGLTWAEARETLLEIGVDLGEKHRNRDLFGDAGFAKPNVARAYELISDALGLPDPELHVRTPALLREIDGALAAATTKKIRAVSSELDEVADHGPLRHELLAALRELSAPIRWKWDLALLRRFYPRRGHIEKALGYAAASTGKKGLATLDLATATDDADLQRRIVDHARELGVFHWHLVFPEVFKGQNGGFHCILANPPFKGDRDLRGAIGETAVSYLRDCYVKGAATLDLCGFFIQRFDDLLGTRASFSTVAPNSIAQGRNRTAGLRPLISGEEPRFALYRAVQTMPWPGEAAVHVALLAARRASTGAVQVREVGAAQRVGATKTRALRQVTALSSFLDGGVELELRRLPSGSTPLAFTGMFPRGPFDFELNDPNIAKLPERERRVLFAYLNNKDVQSQPRPHARRLILDVYNALVEADLHEEEAEVQEAWLYSKLPKTMALLEPAMAERRELPDSARNKKARSYTWLFEEVRPGLRAAWDDLDHVITIGAVGKIFVPFRLPKIDAQTGLEIRPTHQLFVIPSSSGAVAAALTASIFECFTRRVCSTMEDRLRFSPSQVFPFFPFPWAPVVDKDRERLNPLAPPKALETALGKAARAVLDHRQAVLDHPAKHGLGHVGKSDSFGPTKLYNLYDDPECTVPAIQQLRELHVSLTRAVLDAYGWTDLKPRWEFGTPWIDGTTRYFPDAAARAALLDRLQKLNHERHALELELCEKHDIPIPASTATDEEDAEEDAGDE